MTVPCCLEISLSVGGLERIAFPGISAQDATETEPTHGRCGGARKIDAQLQEG